MRLRHASIKNVHRKLTARYTNRKKSHPKNGVFSKFSKINDVVKVTQWFLRATKVGGAAGLAGWPGWLACRLKFIDLIVKVILGAEASLNSDSVTLIIKSKNRRPARPASQKVAPNCNL